MGETHTKTDELKRAIAELQFFIEEIQKNGILESKHEGENVIDTFYNIMLSSRIIAKVEDCRRSSYEFPDADRFTPKVIGMIWIMSIVTQFMNFTITQQVRKICSRY